MSFLFSQVHLSRSCHLWFCVGIVGLFSVAKLVWNSFFLDEGSSPEFQKPMQ